MTAPDGRDPSAARRFRMYVSGDSPNSHQALANFTAMAERYLVPYSLEVVDVLEEPERAMDERVLVTPTLVRLGTPPVHIIGNLSDSRAVLASLTDGGLGVAPGDARVSVLIRNLMEMEAELQRLVSGQADAILGTTGGAMLLQDAQQALQKSVVHFRELANVDPLTGIANRRLFDAQLEQAVERSGRENGRLLALLYVDVDHFKQVNDTLGHDAGDRLLQAISERLGRCLRGTDSLARVGGDEFAILLENIGERRVAERIASKIQASMAEPFELAGILAYVRVSIGVGFFPDNATDAETLTHAADAAMYRAKQTGEGGFAIAE